MREKSKLRRINLFGGPGCGKSTLAAFLFRELKQNSLLADINKPCYNFELVQEYCKLWAYKGTVPNKWDQLHIFSEQLKSEYDLLNNGVDVVITDSPIHLSVVYGEKDDLSYHLDLFTLATKFESEYPSLNIFLHRGNKPYNNNGRFQSKSEAVDMDVLINNYLRYNLIPHITFGFMAKHALKDFVFHQLGLI